jgi:hypothetical protein
MLNHKYEINKLRLYTFTDRNKALEIANDFSIEKMSDLDFRSAKIFAY